MDFKEFSIFLKHENDRLKLRYDNSETIFSDFAKLMEELWEFSEQVLGKYGFQKKEKNAKFNKQNLEEEFADVFIVLSLIWQKLDIDIENAVSKKIEKIKNRNY